MNDERNNRPDLNDAQLEGMLRDFFRLEMPAELNRPFSETVASRAATQSQAMPAVRLTIVADSPEPAAHSRPRRSAMAVVSALAAMVMTAVVVMNWDSTGASVPQVSKDVPQIQPEEQLLDVSKDGGKSKSTHVIGEDGVTLEETEGVDLAPRK